MSLTALAVVNRQGTPLYLRDYANESHLIFNLDGQLGMINDGTGDIFGDDITEMTSKQHAEWPCQLKYQFILHSAIQRLEEVLKDNQWKVQGATGMDACWVGFLCASDNLRAYGKFVCKIAVPYMFSLRSLYLNIILPLRISNKDMSQQILDMLHL